jgi:predicted RNA-binding Zn-ribbon protein involved in translation (DUF1610 family)
MSDIIDKLVEGAGQVISEVDRKRRINRAKQELQDLRAQEAQSINALSAQVLALYEAGTLTQPELISLCKGVDEVRRQVQDKEAELEQLQPPPPPAAAQPDSAARCPSCGVAVVAGAEFCQNCGNPLAQRAVPAPVHFCVRCGAQLRATSRFCPNCGETVPRG